MWAANTLTLHLEFLGPVSVCRCGQFERLIEQDLVAQILDNYCKLLFIFIIFRISHLTHLWPI